MRAAPECGFIFATSGAGYTDLARRAAATLKACCPTYPIDLFTDQEVSDPVFDRIVPLDWIWFRPKIEALRRSRFRKTIYLDADLYVLADISDIFAVLNNFDFAAAHDLSMNAVPNRRIWRETLPLAFPQVNAGLIGLKRSSATARLLDQWRAAMIESAAITDQPILRELLFHSKLRIAILPAFYNLMEFDLARVWTSMFPAPRVIHHYRLHQHLEQAGPEIKSLEALVGGELLGHFAKLAAADHLLSPNNSAVFVPAYRRASLAKRLIRQLLKRR